MEYMQSLFFTWHDRIEDTPEFDTVLNALCRDPKTDFKGHDEDSTMLINCIIAEREQAFRGGFDCAVELLKSGLSE